MSETVILWIFGTVIAVLGGWLLGLTRWMRDTDTKVTKIVALLLLNSKQASKILHDSDDKHGIDGLLEKYYKLLDSLLNNYESHHYDLTDDEWHRLFEACEEIVNSEQFPKGERLAAVAVLQGRWLLALATHKRQRAGTPIGTPK